MPLLGLSSQCTVVTAVSLSVSDYTQQMFCPSVNQSLDYAANACRAVYVSMANLPSYGVPGHQAPNRGISIW